MTDGICKPGFERVAKAFQDATPWHLKHPALE